MATTLANLRAGVRIELRDPSGYRFQDADIDHSINQAYRSAFLRVTTAIQNYFVLPLSIDIVGGQRAYAFPSDHLRTKRLEYVSGNSVVPLKKRDRGVSPNYTAGVNPGITSGIFEYDEEGNNFVLEPTPQSDLDDGLILTYYQTSTPLVSPTDTIHAHFKDLWVNVIILEAAWASFGQTQAEGGIVSNDIEKRLTLANTMMDKSLALRSLSPIVRRKKGYFR